MRMDNGTKHKAIRAACTRLLVLQMPDGALPMGGAADTAKRRIVPYFANQGLQGLVIASTVEGDPNLRRAYQKAARDWVLWYDAHRNTDGTIYDFEGGPSAWNGTGKYDSTDSYASTYLELLGVLFRSDRDTKWLRGRYPSIRRSVVAIHLTRQRNGLTTATPTWLVMYTMDNVEVLRGLRAAAFLADAVGNTADARTWSAMADKTQESIGRDLWDQGNSCYLVGLQTDGGKMTGGIAKWYPDVMANLMALGWLANDPAATASRHRALYGRLVQKADSPDIGFGVSGPTEDYLERLVWWGFAARAMKDTRRLEMIQTALATGLGGATIRTVNNPAILGHLCRLLAGGAND